MNRVDLAPEGKVLLCCARTALDENVWATLTEILETHLDWEYILRQSALHSISPLVYWNLHNIDNKNIPQYVMAELRKKYLETVGQNMVFYHELKRMLETFKNAGIAVICLKGAFLAEAIYKNIGLRPLSDIDLLIKDKDFPKIGKKLWQLHYRPVGAYPPLGQEETWTAACESAQARYTNLKTKILLEVHWHIHHLSSPYNVNIGTLWENAQPVTLAGVDTLAFAPEDLLQHLCLHMHHHSTQGVILLRWCCDIAEVIAHYQEQVDWEYLVESTRNYGTEIAVSRGLYIAQTYLGSSVPDQVFIDLNVPLSGFDFPGMVGKPTERK
jgi:hypothetical protein